MVSSSKILTVSYGTFSCTAEGFEDPLAVVKDTTHFFRGVIREDRFFGAEPPQFDPEMAAELLQSQIAAQAGEGSLTLRGPYAGGGASSGALSAALAAGPAAMRKPAEAPVQSAAPEAEPADTVPEAEPAEAAPAVDAAETAPEAEAGEPSPEAELVEDEPASSLTEAAEQPAAGPVAETTAETDDAPDNMADSIAAALATADDTDHDAGADAQPEAAAPAGEDSLEAEAEFFEAEEADAPAAEQESIAEKLRRIRAVVASAPARAEQAPEPDAPEAEAGSAVLDALVSEQKDVAQSVADTLAGIDFDEDLDLGESPDDDLAVADDDALAAQDDVAAPEEPAAEPAPAAQTAPETEVLPVESPSSRRPRARVLKVRKAAIGAATPAPEASLPEQGADTVSSLSAEDEDELARELAAVRAELSADFDDAWGEDDSDDWSDTGAKPAQGAAALSEDDDWGLGDGWDDAPEPEVAPAAEEAAEPAALAGPEPEVAPEPEAEPEQAQDDEAERFAAAAEAERLAREDVRKAVKLSSPARALLTEKSVDQEDTSRILDETNTQLEEPEGSRRRSAIAHLRAAVVATRADRLLGRRKDSEEVIEPYREDLADVVRPRRPEAPSTHTERPTETLRPAPLKLVAEQRVDAEQVPARPRRVQVADPEAELGGSTAGGDFAAYAESVGATELPELLEAAAAFMSFVERREQFSRPQLMTKVRQAEAEESSREDRLRSFGQLLREGKIEKTRGGRFTASERISFKPDARAAG